MWAATLDHLKTIGVALGVTSAVVGTYNALGLPVPATIQLVDSRIGQVNGSIKSLTELVLEGQLEQHDLARGAMRAERSALEQSLHSASAGTQLTIQSRIGALDDNLKVLEERDSKLRVKVQELREGQGRV